MQPWVVTLILCLCVLGLFALVFSAAWTWMSRYDEIKKELLETKKQLKETREEYAALEDLLEWRQA